MAYDLATIRTLVRNLTHRLSPNQLDDNTIDFWVNTFMIQDMPNTIHLFDLRRSFEFYTQPNVDQYSTNGVPGTPLYDFKNRVLNVYPPVYFSGLAGSFTQDPSFFNANWIPQVLIKDTLLRGTNLVGPYAGSLYASSSVPVIQGNVVFTANDVNGTSMVLIDYPLDNLNGLIGIPGLLPPYVPNPANNINYVTGIYTITFPNAVPNGIKIFSETQPYQASRPYSMLYYNDMFVVRPVPDMTYKVKFEVDLRPTALMNAGDLPYQNIWWQLVAYGTAIKILQLNGEQEEADILMPAFIQQQCLVNRPTLLQYSNERSSTIMVSNNRSGYYYYPPYRPY